MAFVLTLNSLCAMYPEIENTMLVPFDIKFIGRDQKQRSNGEACRASPTCFWSDAVLSDFLTSRMHYDVGWRRHLTNRTLLSRSMSICSQSPTDVASNGIA